jgi:serine/threonine protein kinase
VAAAYIPGPSLAEAIAEGGPLDEAGVRRLGAALAEGLAAIHDCGLIHRDLKPSNVILADDGPRIIDFGSARGADATALTGSGAVIGTLRYMSPEQLHGQELTPHSDVFALGTVLAYAATGHDPFEAPTPPSPGLVRRWHATSNPVGNREAPSKHPDDNRQAHCHSHRPRKARLPYGRFGRVRAERHPCRRR